MFILVDTMMKFPFFLTILELIYKHAETCNVWVKIIAMVYGVCIFRRLFYCALSPS
jgi:hypothetical protein